MKFDEDSFEEHINSLIETTMRLSSYLPIHWYFKTVKDIQNSYMVELRRLFVLKLLKEGLSNSEIARLMCRDHATISYLLKTTNEEDSIRKSILPHYQQWVVDEVYPETYTELVPSADHKHGFRSVVNYKLKSIHNGQDVRQNSSADIGIETVEGE